MGILLTDPDEAVNSFTILGILAPADEIGGQRIAIEVTMKSMALFLSNTPVFISGATMGPSGTFPGGTELQDASIDARIKKRQWDRNLFDTCM